MSGKNGGGGGFGAFLAASSRTGAAAEHGLLAFMPIFYAKVKFSDGISDRHPIIECTRIVHDGILVYCATPARGIREIIHPRDTLCCPKVALCRQRAGGPRAA